MFLGVLGIVVVLMLRRNMVSDAKQTCMWDILFCDGDQDGVYVTIFIKILFLVNKVNL